jgi:RNA polymerase sigma factor (sigma-70 family)
MMQIEYEPNFSNDLEVSQFLHKIAKSRIQEGTISVEDKLLINAAISYLYEQYYHFISYSLWNVYKAKDKQPDSTICWDLAQEAFLKFYKRLFDGPFNKEEFNAKSYILTIAHNLLRNYSRSSASKTKLLHEDHEQFQTVTYASVEETVIQREQQTEQQKKEALLKKIIQGMQSPENDTPTSRIYKDYAKILIMYYLEDQSIWDIAAYLFPDSMSQNSDTQMKQRAYQAAKLKLSRARDKLREKTKLL